MTTKFTIVLFGEAEKGFFSTPIHCRSLTELATTLGNPPKDSIALHWAVQALMLHRDVVFIRVEEEGFSKKDYLMGLKGLEENDHPMGALFMPGVGDPDILDAFHRLCEKRASVLITTESDLYDLIRS